MSEKPKRVSIPCTTCGGGLRTHDVLEEVSRKADPDVFWFQADYQICQCRGCEEIRFRKFVVTEDDLLVEAGTYVPGHDYIYPEPKSVRKPSLDPDALPRGLEEIYLETLHAYGGGSFILAAGGLRAMVEAVCKIEEVDGGNLKLRINGLAERDLLVPRQAELLHEARFLGNSALHEIDRPTRSELDAGLDIVETLLRTLYVLPDQAKRMKRRRDRRNSERKDPDRG